MVDLGPFVQGLAWQNCPMTLVVMYPVAMVMVCAVLASLATWMSWYLTDHFLTFISVKTRQKFAASTFVGYMSLI